MFSESVCWFTISLKAVLLGYFAPETFAIKIYKTQTLYIKVIMFVVNILKILVPTCYSPKAFLSLTKSVLELEFERVGC